MIELSRGGPVFGAAGDGAGAGGLDFRCPFKLTARDKFLLRPRRRERERRLATDNNNSPLTHGHFIRHGHGHAARRAEKPWSGLQCRRGGILMRYNSRLMRGSHLMMVLARSHLINMSHYTGLRTYYNECYILMSNDLPF